MSEVQKIALVYGERHDYLKLIKDALASRGVHVVIFSDGDRMVAALDELDARTAAGEIARENVVILSQVMGPYLLDAFGAMRRAAQGGYAGVICDGAPFTDSDINRLRSWANPWAAVYTHKRGYFDASALLGTVDKAFAQRPGQPVIDAGEEHVPGDAGEEHVPDDAELGGSYHSR